MYHSGVLGYKQHKWKLTYLSQRNMIGRLPGSSQINGMAGGQGLGRGGECPRSSQCTTTASVWDAKAESEQSLPLNDKAVVLCCKHSCSTSK